MNTENLPDKVPPKKEAPKLIKGDPCSVHNVQELFAFYADDIKAIMPEGLLYERLLRIALTSLAKMPKLKECTQTSFIGAIVQSVMTGLEPDGIQACIIPYKKVAQFQPMYQGIIKLCRNADVKIIYAHPVYENDFFEMDLGTNKSIEHKPEYKGDRGEVIGYYAVYYNKFDEPDFEYMTKAEVVYTRSKSSRAKEGSPWDSWFDEMAKKTVLKRLLKRAPKSIELNTLVDIDNQIETGKRISPRNIFDSIDLEPPPDADEQHPEEIPEPQPLIGEENQESPPEKSVEEQVMNELDDA